jgi:hypothetical protein
MKDVRQAEETLAVIRRLMERGQRYEAITARGALVAGLAALGTSAACAWLEASDRAFLLAWLGVAAVSAAWVVLPALVGTRATAGRWGSPQARAVGVAVLPPYVAGAVLTALLVRAGLADLLPATWMLMHGCAILATWHHAPRRLVALGVAFLATGAVLAFAPVPRDAAMAIGFGGLNVLHALGRLGARSAGPDDA